MRFHAVGKELRLKQQYFWTAASLADIMRRFKNIGKDITEFPECKESPGCSSSSSNERTSRCLYPAQRREFARTFPPSDTTHRELS